MRLLIYLPENSNEIPLTLKNAAHPAMKKADAAKIQVNIPTFLMNVNISNVSI